MNRARWEWIEEVFHQVLEADEGERDRILSEACTNDTELRREVEALLDGEAGASASIRRVLAAEASSVVGGARTTAADAIGPRDDPQPAAPKPEPVPDRGSTDDNPPDAAIHRTLGHRARKLVGRNKYLVMGAVLVAAALIATTVIPPRQTACAEAQYTNTQAEITITQAAAVRAEAEATLARHAEHRLEEQRERLLAEERYAVAARASSELLRVERASEELRAALARMQRAEQQLKRASETEWRAVETARAATQHRKNAEALLQQALSNTRAFEAHLDQRMVEARR